MPADRKISRRTWLGRLAALGAAAGMPILAFVRPTEEKASKAAVRYRDYPKQMQMCGMCKFFVGGGMMDHGMMGCGMTGNDMPEAPVIDAGMMGGMMRRGMMGGGVRS